MKRARGGGDGQGAFNAGGGGSGGRSGGAGDARAESARQALLLATQSIGVNAAEVKKARVALDEARYAAGLLGDVLLESRSADGTLFTADDMLLLGMDGNSSEIVSLALKRGANPQGAAGWSGFEERAERGEAAHSALDARRSGGGGGGGGADARAKSARQALLLATQALGVNAATANKARFALDEARDAVHIFFNALLQHTNTINGEPFTADDVLYVGMSSTEVVRLALERGADPNGTSTWSNRNRAHLHAAALDGYADSAKLLLEAGADKDIADDEGMTPLHYAAFKGHFDCLRLLLEAGADKDRADEDGGTPLHRAATGGAKDCLVLLLEAGADKDRASNGGRTPLHCTASRGEADCMKLLLQAGADTDRVTDKGYAPLHSAAWRGQAGCVKLLLEAGADKNRPTNSGEVPLHYAANHCQADCTKLLLEAGADKDLADKNGSTPLHSIVETVRWVRGRIASLELLLEAGADASTQNGDGKTALELAEQNKHAEAAAVLRAALSGVSAPNRRRSTRARRRPAR